MPPRRPRLFVLDGTAALFRAYHAAPPMRATDGSEAGALHGFGLWTGRLLRRRRPAYVAMVFDAGRATFRSELHPAYKAHRSEPPEDLPPQLELAPLLAEAAGIAAFRQVGYEADDLMATLAHRCRGAGLGAVLVSPDKDVLQLVDDEVKAMDPKDFAPIDADQVQDRFGVAPHQLVDLMALAGDPSDNVPGVPGVGLKTAAALIAAFGSLDALYDDLPGIAKLPLRGAARLGARLAAHREQAMLSRELVRLRDDAPLGDRPLSVGSFRWRGPAPESHAFWQQTGFLSLRRSLEELYH